MAAYAATITLDQRSAARLGNGGFKLLSGQADITNYNQTLGSLTGISGQFKTLFRVVCDGVSSLGYVVRWSKSDNSFKAFYPSKAVTPTGNNTKPAFAIVNGTIGNGGNLALGLSGNTAAGLVTSNLTAGGNITLNAAISPVQAPVFTGDAVSAAAGTQVSSDVNIGVVNFIAFGV